MKRAVFGILLTLILAACTQPIESGTYMTPPDARADKVAARVGEAVEVTVMGGFGTRDNFYLEEFTHPGVNLGACFLYSADVETEGGLCIGGEQPLLNGLSMVDGTTFAKEFEDFVVKRGEYREIKHTFTFTSNQPGTIVIVPVYLFSNGHSGSPGFEKGPENIVRVTFK